MQVTVEGETLKEKQVLARNAIRSSTNSWLVALPDKFLFAHHKSRIRLVLRVPMKHMIGIGVLIAMAFGLRSWLQTSLALDIYIHDTYWAVPLRIIAFWCLMGTAFAWLLVFAWASIRRQS